MSNDLEERITILIRQICKCGHNKSKHNILMQCLRCTCKHFILDFTKETKELTFKDRVG